jgi:hypothetical protein
MWHHENKFPYGKASSERLYVYHATSTVDPDLACKTNFNLFILKLKKFTDTKLLDPWDLNSNANDYDPGHF